MKPFLNFDQQVALLLSRKLKIKNIDAAKNVLKAENYYRLSGYFKLFTKTGSDDFQDNFTFKKVLKVYEFDNKLRLLLDKYLAMVEISARTRIAYNLAKTTTPISYLDVRNFRDSSRHAAFIQDKDKEIRRNQRNPMISHYSTDSLPIWVLVEILTFGCLSKMYANLKPNLQNQISRSTDYEKVFHRDQYSSLLLAACNLRNVCAHHGRLYGKIFPYNISLSPSDQSLFNRYGISLPTGSSSNAFQLIFSLFKLLHNKTDRKKFINDLKIIFLKYSRYIDIKKLGFTKKWVAIYSKC